MTDLKYKINTAIDNEDEAQYKSLLIEAYELIADLDSDLSFMEHKLNEIKDAQSSNNNADVPVYRQHRVKYKGQDEWSSWSAIVNDRCDCTKEYFDDILTNPISGSGHTYQVRELYASEPLPPLKDE